MAGTSHTIRLHCGYKDGKDAIELVCSCGGYTALFLEGTDYDTIRTDVALHLTRVPKVTVRATFQEAWDKGLDTFSVSMNRCGRDHIKRMCSEFGYKHKVNRQTGSYVMTRRKQWG